jgi:hypothetical protein
MLKIDSINTNMENGRINDSVDAMVLSVTSGVDYDAF